MPKLQGWCTNCHKIKIVRVSQITRDPSGLCADCEAQQDEKSSSAR